MPPLVLIPIPIAVAAIIFIIIRRIIINKSKGKKFVVVGPVLSGKTTLVKWITKDEFNPMYTPTGFDEVTQYVDTKGRNIQFTDFGGSEVLLVERFDQYIKNSDVLFFVFNLKEFIESESYRKEHVYPRVDFLLNKINEKGSPKVLFIGSHRDLCDKTDAELITTVCELFQSSNVAKAAQYHIIFADLTKRKYVTGILKELEKLLDSIA